MTTRCDALKVLAELEFRMEREHALQGYLFYSHMQKILADIVHEIQREEYIINK